MECEKGEAEAETGNEEKDGKGMDRVWTGWKREEQEEEEGKQQEEQTNRRSEEEEEMEEKGEKTELFIFW